MKFYSTLALFLFLSIEFINAQTSATAWEYLGQSTPADEAKIFAPGIISTGMQVRDIAITPDGKEIYYCVFGQAFTFSTILFTKHENGKWTSPRVAPFALDTRFKYIEPCISHDGKKLFYASNKTLNEDTGGKRDFDIWVVERENEAWGEPKNLGLPVSTSAPEFFPSVSKNGTIYFTREQEDGTSLIVRSKLIGGNYTEAEVLPEQINYGADRFNAFIDPDEKFIIVSVFRAKDGLGAVDYYISFRSEDDKWSKPINMGQKVNSAFNEYSPYVSPDGKFLFFMSTKPNENLFKGILEFSAESINKIHNTPGNGNSTIYWISSKLLDDLKLEIKKADTN